MQPADGGFSYHFGGGRRHTDSSCGVVTVASGTRRFYDGVALDWRDPEGRTEGRTRSRFSHDSQQWPQHPYGFRMGRGGLMRPAGIEPATSRSGGARSIP